MAQLAPPEQESVDPGPRGAVELGVIATPALDERAVEQFAKDLGAVLAERYPDVRWELTAMRDPLVAPPAHLTELVDAARARLLEHDWDLAVAVTDVPLRLDRRPLLSHASPTHAVALISLPALGVLRRERRLRDAATDAVGSLIGDGRRLKELADEIDDPSAGQSATFLARVIEGNLRLLLGMIRANRPWRLATRLSGALVGALAAATFALINDDVWRMADTLNALRLSALTLAATVTAVVTLIAAHELWERATDPRSREQVMLFNLVTFATLAIGILSLYATVFVASLAVAGLLIDASLFSRAVDHPVDLSHYLRLAWLTSSLATVGGALGGALESDAAVREAAYAYRPEDDVVEAA